jgi:hypothetical protein
MKRFFTLTAILFISISLFSQDSTMNDLTKDMTGKDETQKKPVKIFSSDKAILSNTTEMVGKGKMLFKITHNFDNIDGKDGIFGRVLGLDKAWDVRIAFHIGLGKNLDVNVSRDKGAANVTKIYELALKYRFATQMENDPSHPISLAIFLNTAVATAQSVGDPRVPGTSNFENHWVDFSSRMSQVVQLIIAKKIGRVSLQLNPTFVHTNHVINHDMSSIFALGGVIRFPVSRSMNIIVDYYHPFRNEESKNYFNSVDQPYNPEAFKFYDPLGIGLEINTAGHVFNLNFLNSKEILENRFIPRTVNSWTKGQFRWGFSIGRTFSLWRTKKK